jgi:hypothetical protein
MSDDARDERLGRMLDVEPLDALSRRRLVRTAMEASESEGKEPRRTWRLVAAASLVSVVVAGGVTYLATRDSNTTQPTALADRNAEREGGTTSVVPTGGAPAAGTPSGASDTQSSAKQAIEAAGSLADLGNFGDLSTDSELNRVRSALEALPAAGATSAQSTPAAAGDARAATLLSELRAQSCAGELPEGTVVAVGRARFDTRDAIVVKTMQPDGSVSLDAVVADPCEVRPLD